jgi:hypothetical protein
MKRIFPEILFGATEAKAVHMKETVFRIGRGLSDVNGYFLG